MTHLKTTVASQGDANRGYYWLTRGCSRLRAAVALTFILSGAACTSPDPTPVPTITPAPAVVVSPTATPLPTAIPPPTSTAAPPTPTFTSSPTDTPLPPTNTPVLTSTPKPRPTATLHPTPPPTSGPTRTPRPTSTPMSPSPIAGLKNGDWLETNKRPRAAEIRELTWVADSVSDAERTAAEMLIACARWYPATFNALLHKSWLKDDITDNETVAVESLYWLSFYGPDVPRAILQKSWVADGISSDAATVIRYLYGMVWIENDAIRQNIVETAIQILAMPFLETVESADALAVRSLARLERSSEDAFLEIMSHPKLSDGITDEEAKIVALLGGTYSKKPETVDVLLRGTGVYLEERTIDLPLSGETLLVIIRIRDQITDRMDILEHSVRSIEGFMGEPLPTSYIALFFEDATTYELGGNNFGTHVTMSLLYDVENGHLEKVVGHTIAHEVAHYYYGGNNEDWIDEGAAELLGSISENARTEAPIEATRYPCASAKTITELENLDAKVKTSEFLCNYSLGEGFFLDLYHALGEATFRQGFRNLYLKSLSNDDMDDCEGTDLSICHLAAAFKSDVSADVEAKVDKIVSRWYGVSP